MHRAQGGGRGGRRSPRRSRSEDKVVDLMAALEAAVAAAKEARGAPPDAAADKARRRSGRRTAVRPARRSADAGLVAQPASSGRDRRPALRSNLDKVLYPEVGFTKAEVIDYYVRIAPAMLPTSADRGVTLRRYPNGVDGDVVLREALPRSPPRLRGHRASGPATAAAPSTTAASTRSPRWPGPPTWPPSSSTRPWPGRRHRVARPWCVFDLDPGAPAGIAECAEVGLRHPRRARRHRPGLPGQDLGLQGAAALRAAEPPAHPRPRRAFAQAVAQVLEKHHPDEVTSVMAKQARPGQGVHRLEPEQPAQDHGGRLLVAGPSPSDGVDAGHLGRGQRRRRRRSDPLRFVAADVLERVQRLGDLFADAATLEQELPPA